MLVQLAHHTVGIASDRIFILISVQRDGAHRSIQPKVWRRRLAAARRCRSGG